MRRAALHLWMSELLARLRARKEEEQLAASLAVTATSTATQRITVGPKVVVDMARRAMEARAARKEVARREEASSMVAQVALVPAREAINQM